MLIMVARTTVGTLVAVQGKDKGRDGKDVMALRNN